MAKKTKKRSANKGGDRTITHIYYECKNNSCVESVHQAHVGSAGSIVVISAIGTDVKLQFGPYKGSAFKGGKQTISIGADKSKHLVVDQSAAADSYSYDLTCDACQRNLGPPPTPEMIVT